MRSPSLLKRDSSRMTLAIAIGLMPVLLGCRSDRSIDGLGLLLDPTERGHVANFTEATNLEVSFDDTLATTGENPFLSLGALENLESRILLRFGAVPDTVEIASVALILDTNTLLATGRSKSKFTAHVRQMTTPWDEQSVTSENFQMPASPSFANSEIRSTTVDFSSADSSFIESARFEFDDAGVNLVRNWADPAFADTYGVVVDFEDSDFIKEFFSSENGFNKPRLELRVSENGAIVDTIFTTATEDAYVVSRTGPNPEGPLYVDHMFSHRSVIRFDLSEIPREAFINRAELTLNVDQENTLVKSSGLTFQLVRLQAFDAMTKEAVPDPSAPTTSTVISPLAVVSRSGGEVLFGIRDIVQLWVTKDFENNGLLLRSVSPGANVGHIAFHSKATIASLAPRLRVWYSTIESSPQ